ncbi:MAG: hypothetical protein ACM3YM_00310 [Sphingomonadales bacterium]
MNCDIYIEFSPGDFTVPRILTRIESQGFALRGLRLVPCHASERSTLQVDLGGCRDRSELVELERELLGIEGTLSVIHLAPVGTDAGAAGRRAVA